MKHGVLSCLLAVILGSSASGQIVGWRGDGSGRFPNAAPPAQWGKVSRVIGGLRCQADKPAGAAAAGAPGYCGAVTEWLVVGPLPAGAEGKAIDEAVIADEGAVEPKAGDAVKGLAWRKASVPGTTVDFGALFAKDAGDAAEYYAPHGLHVFKMPFVAYAHSYLYAAEEGQVLVRVRAQKAAKVWVNGQLAFPAHGVSVVTLKKGWNRVLVKAANAVFEKKPANPWGPSDYPSWWFVDLSLTARWPFETDQKNIRWATEMPNFGVACPVIVGERVFVLAEPGRVICVDTSSGKVLWDREPSFWDTLSDAERADAKFAEEAALAKRLGEIRAAEAKPDGLTPELAKERDDVIAKIAKALAKADAGRFTVKSAGHGNCLPTPVSDGKTLYAALGNGLVAAYDLDGRLKWAAAVSPGRNQEHGITSSAALAGGKVLVFHCDLAGIDARTGHVDWKTDIWRKEPNYGDVTHQTPVTFKVAGQDYAFIHGLIVRVSDGEVIQENRAWAERQDIPTPVAAGGNLYVLSSSGILLYGPLPTAADDLQLKKPTAVRTFARILGAASHGFACASPLIHDGLAYAVDCMGTLFVIDLAEAKVVYQRELGTGFESKSAVHSLGTSYASPTLAGGRIYVFGMDGTTIVFKPGRTYEEVARNKIEDIWNPTHWSAHAEGFASTPVADGKYLYVRGDKYLYCIGEK